MPIPTEFIQIDEEGFGLSREVRIQDPLVAQEILQNLEISDTGTLLSTFGGEPVLVEAFDEPYVASQVELNDSHWKIELPFGVSFGFELSSLSLDEWDRFHGYCSNKIPFVFSRKAQAQFFNLLQEFGDDFIVFKDQKIQIPPYWPAREEIEKEAYWSKIYNSEPSPGWNLGGPAEALKDMLPRLKISKSRILVLGCGDGHDAAYFAKAGHLVTAVDISPLAIARAKNLYGDLANIQFIEADLFNLPKSFDQSFDVIFEHTCFCAINPAKRQEAVRVWNRVLVSGGHLMGVFFTFEKRQGPPYGGTEWELRQRLKANYQPIFWGRWQTSLPRRQGKELFIYCKKK